jgi:transposase
MLGEDPQGQSHPAGGPDAIDPRRGQKRAILAVAHVIVVRAFYRLSRNEPYRELGANYVDGHRRHQLVDRGARHLERLGYGVNNQPVTAA